MEQQQPVGSEHLVLGALLDAGVSLGAKFAVTNGSGELTAVRGLSDATIDAFYGVNGASDELGFAIARLVQIGLAGRKGDQPLSFSGPPSSSVVLKSVPFGQPDQIEGVVVIIADTTEQRYADNMTVDFVASLAHELRSPLSAISLLAEGIATTPEVAKEHNFVGRLQDEVARAAVLVDSLKAMSRSEVEAAVQFDTHQVNSLLNACIERVQTLAEFKEIELIVDSGEPRTIYGNRREVISAVCHLLENAIEYSPRNSTVRVIVDGNESLTSISVCDHGFGIASEDCERIFERFVRLEQAKRAHVGGSGIGLSIVKRIAFSNGGEVMLDSKPGKGATFTLQLSAHAPMAGRGY